MQQITQELLGDSLVETQHLKELQSLAQRKLTVLQQQSLCAAAHADTLCEHVTQQSTQTAQDLQRELAGKCCELAAACINIHRWKKQAALQQLRLVSVQEDLGHQKVYAEALSAECTRRQELSDNLKAQLQEQRQHTAKLDLELAQAASKSTNLQVTLIQENMSPHCIWSLTKTVIDCAEMSGQHASDPARKGRHATVHGDQVARSTLQSARN